MKQIPFRRFDGFLKQHSHETLSPLEQELFNVLFPLFEGDDKAEKMFEEWKNNSLVQALSPLIQVVKGDRRQRRFAGYDFPRKRYYAVAVDSDGSDNQTLAHELRAYRDPVNYGMVEVLDIADGANLMFSDAKVALPPEQAIVVIIHDLDRLPERLHKLNFRELPAHKGKALHMYKFPYKIYRRAIENVIDLRYPEVRDWFFETFRVPGKESGSHLPDQSPDPTTAYSRFHLANQRAPVPSSFWKMLPTLTNPDLGGGNPGTTGSTIFMIGHWMRQNQVGAFVYPSARCDVRVIFENGAMQQSFGWNLVDYENTHPLQENVRLTTVDQSPWAWVSFPDGVSLQIASSAQWAGSLLMEGVVNFWAADYQGQLESLQVARKAHGVEGRLQPGHKKLAAIAFWMGVLGLRWLRLALARQSASEVNNQIIELQGLGLFSGSYEVVGRLTELWTQLKNGPVQTQALITEIMEINERLGRSLGNRFSDPSLEKLAQLGNDLEFLLMMREQHMRTGPAGIGTSTADYARIYRAELKTWFDPEKAEELLAFMSGIGAPVTDTGELQNQSVTGSALIATAYQNLCEIHERSRGR